MVDVLPITVTSQSPFSDTVARSYLSMPSARAALAALAAVKRKEEKFCPVKLDKN